MLHFMLCQNIFGGNDGSGIMSLFILVSFYPEIPGPTFSQTFLTSNFYQQKS